MTDRLAGVIVTFERDTRVDDAEHMLIALQQVKGVVSVAPVIADATLHMAKERARWELREKIWEALKP